MTDGNRGAAGGRRYRRQFVGLAIQRRCRNPKMRDRDCVAGSSLIQATASRLKPISQLLRFDCDTTTTRLRRKIDMVIFARVETRKEAGARDTS